MKNNILFTVLSPSNLNTQMGRDGLEPPMFLMSQIYSLLSSPIRRTYPKEDDHNLPIIHPQPC